MRHMRKKLVDHMAAHIVAHVHTTCSLDGWAGLLYDAAWHHTDALRQTYSARNAARYYGL